MCVMRRVFIFRERKRVYVYCLVECVYLSRQKACRGGSLAVLEALLSAGARTDTQNIDGDTLAHVAVRSAQRAILRRLMKRNPDVTAKNLKGNTPLHLAASLGDVESCETLLLADAYINESNEDGDTPLHLAFFHSKLRVAEFLIMRGMVNILSFARFSLLPFSPHPLPLRRQPHTS